MQNFRLNESVILHRSDRKAKLERKKIGIFYPQIAPIIADEK